MRLLPFAFVLALVAIPLTSALPNLVPPATVLPLNTVANPGFESGLSGWRLSLYAPLAATLASPGAAETAKALRVTNHVGGAFAYQPLAVPPALGQYVALEFWAKATPDATKPNANLIEAIARWNPRTGAGQTTAALMFQGASMRLIAWDTAAEPVPAPTDGAWHRYEIVLAGPLGIAALFMDGELVTTVGADPLGIDPANVLIVGDVAGCDCAIGAAPTVEWDEIYFGPAV